METVTVNVGIETVEKAGKMQTRVKGMESISVFKSHSCL